MPWPPETPEQWEAEARVKGRVPAPERHPEPDLTTMNSNDEPAWLDKTQPLIKELAPDRQVGGTHYNVMKIQPSRFWMANDYDGDAGMILKYLARHKLKNGRQDVEKALSFVQIRIDNAQFIEKPRRSLISIREFIEGNVIDATTANALIALDFWVQSGHGHGTFSILVADTIKELLAEQYPV